MINGDNEGLMVQENVRIPNFTNNLREVLEAIPFSIPSDLLNCQGTILSIYTE